MDILIITFLKAIKDIHIVIKLWRMRNLTLKERMIVFKTLALFKIAFLALLIIFLDYIFKQIKRFQEHFIWRYSRPKIQDKTFRMDCKNGGLKNIFLKIASLQCLWVKSLYSNSYRNHIMNGKSYSIVFYRKCFRKKFQVSFKIVF